MKSGNHSTGLAGKTMRWVISISFTQKYSLSLNDFAKNLATHLAQNRSSHSTHYACHDICATCFARFPAKPFSS